MVQNFLDPLGKSYNIYYAFKWRDMLKVKLLAIGCLFGFLSMGWAERWTPGENGVLLEFIQAKEVNPTLGWQDCVDKVNAYRQSIGLPPTRTTDGCYEHWTHSLKKDHPELKLPRQFLNYRWEEGKNKELMRSVERHKKEDGKIDWAAVSLEMRDRTPTQCHIHYNTLASHKFPHEEVPAGIPAHEEFEPTYKGFENPFWGSLLEDY